jgi:signal transduction histidine kinase/PAS domain-containing protein
MWALDGCRVVNLRSAPALSGAKSAQNSMKSETDLETTMVIDEGMGREWALLLKGIDQLDIGFTVMGPDLVLVAANQRFQEMLNYPAGLSRPGSSIAEGFRFLATRGEYGPGDVDAQVRQRVELAAQFLPHRFERVRPDGTIIEVVGQPLPGGGMVTTYTDVTIPRQREQALRALSAELELRVEARTAELRQREQELAHKAALLELVISNVNQGISFVNADLKIEICNQKFCDLLQIPPELAQPGSSFVDLARFNAERGEYGPGDVEEIMRVRIEIAKKFLPHQFERTRPSDGVTLEVMGMPTSDGGMVSTYLDITERKQAEDRIRELNETLELRVAERSSQLNAALQTLHQSQEALAQSAAKATLSTLVASVTHELNTPLGNSLMTVSTCSDLTKRFQAQVDSGQLRRSDLTAYLQEMRTGSDLMERNLLRAVDLVKNFKQVAADQASEQRRMFDVGAVVNEVVNTLSPSLKRHAHRVEVNIANELWIDSYPGALGQVLINLINNAYLHAFEGMDSGCVSIDASPQAGEVVLCIADNGAGMSQELLAQLFQPFFSTKIGQGGTGLGMTIVENLVKKTLGGALRVESSVGRGSRFFIRLPQVVPIDSDVGIDAQI